jgi:hypothetical protein
MPFCPKCKYEYNPGIEICPDCDEKLIQSLPEEEPEEEKKEELEFDKDLDLALLGAIDMMNPPYARFLKQSLEDSDIPCLVKRHSGMVGMVEIYVPKDKLEEAKEIKDQIINNF